MCAGGCFASQCVQPDLLLLGGTVDSEYVHPCPVLFLLSHPQQGNLAFRRRISQMAVVKDSRWCFRT